MEFTFKTAQMIRVADEVGSFYVLEKGAYDGDLRVLAKLIAIFGNMTVEEACEEIDKALENDKKVIEMYTDIFDGINKKGFFKTNLQASTTALPVDQEQITSEMYQEMVQSFKEQQLAKI